MGFYGWKPYVPVAKRRARAAKELEKMKKKGLRVQPVELNGRKIAASFWGKGWCDHMESFSDYANRLPRGRTYIRNGSVCHMEIRHGRIEAIVSGSELYNIAITIAPLSDKKWNAVKAACAGQIGSIIDLLRGKLAGGVMEVVGNRDSGLFPLPGEMKFKCDCPDWADMCKHVAAVLYGVGARLDHAPENLFLLRGVNHEELVDLSTAVKDATGRGTSRRRIAAEGLADVFGVEMVDPEVIKQPTGLKPVKPTAKAKRSAASLSVSSLPEPLTGKMISTWRKSLGETQAVFAARLSVTSATISQWENKGEQTLGIRDSTLTLLCKAWRLTGQSSRKKTKHI